MNFYKYSQRVLRVQIPINVFASALSVFFAWMTCRSTSVKQNRHLLPVVLRRDVSSINISLSSEILKSWSPEELGLIKYSRGQ